MWHQQTSSPMTDSCIAHTDSSETDQGVGDLFMSALRRWGTSGPRRFLFFLRIAYRLWRAERRRIRCERHLGSPVPSVVAISPTMRCNYDCQGCYSRGRRTQNELSTEELDVLLSQAEEFGVLAIVVTGGEPLLRPDLIDLFAHHRRLLFIPITNGVLLTPRSARRLARSGNVVTLVSIEGGESDTDERRRPGAYNIVLRAFELLRDARACFGFAAMVTTANVDRLATDVFVDGMISLGCAVGYFTEYVPCGQSPIPGWVLDEESRTVFCRRVIKLRRRKPIVLIQFPYDEYGEDNRCTAAGQKSLHINSQGYIEPCPFAPVARENIREGGLLAAFQSPFLRAIREHPRLLERQRFACALFENRAEIDTLANEIGAHPSD